MDGRSFDRNYVAPHNSLIDHVKILRYDKHPYHESNSAPASIQGDNEDSHASLPENESARSVHSSQSNDGQCKVRSEYSVGSVRKSGISVSNALQARLYQYPVNSDALQHNNRVGFRSRDGRSGTSSAAFNTFSPVKRNYNKDARQSSKLGNKKLSSGSIPDQPTSTEPHSYHRNRITSTPSCSEASRSNSGPANSFNSSTPVSDNPSDQDFHGQDSNLNLSSCSNLSLVQLRLQLKSKSILEIIHFLRDRLNWICEGILRGEVPRDDVKKDYRIINEKEDDGEFVYCLPRCYIVPDTRYDPYDLLYTDSKEAQRYPIYYTVSASHVSKYCVVEGSTVTPTLEWLYERKLFYKIFDIETFRNFRLWKTFSCWKHILCSEKKKGSVCSINGHLFHSNSSFQASILKVRLLCESFCSFGSTQQIDTYQLVSLLDIDTSRTYLIEDFCKFQRNQFNKVRSAITNFRKDVVKLVRNSCQCFYDIEVEQIEKDMKEIENEMKPSDVQKKTKIYKNFQHLREKYGIVEHTPPENKNQTTKKQLSFKHVKCVHLKAVHHRLCAFLRLIDFMIMDMLRRLVKVSMNIIWTHVDASSRQSDHVVASHEKITNKNGASCSQRTAPLFEVSLLLKTHNEDSSGKREQFGNNSGDADNISFEKQAPTRTHMSTILHPSLQDMQVQLKSLVTELEEIPKCYDSLLNEPELAKYVKIPSMYMPSDEVEFNSGPRIRNWPDHALLLGEDVNYQKWVADITVLVNQGMYLSHEYVKQYDGVCTTVANLNIGNLSNSLVEDWSVEQFHKVLKRYSDQINVIEDIPDSARKGLFYVKVDKFKWGCLPYLTRVVDTVNKHLPLIANRRNDSLLRLIKNGERELSSPLKSIEGLVDHLSSLSRLAADIPKLEIEFETVTKMFNVAFKYGSVFDAEEKALYQTLQPSFNQMKHLVVACEAKKDTNIQRFSKELDILLENLSNRVKTLSHNIHNPALLDRDAVQSSVLETIDFFKDDLDLIRTQVKTVSSYEECFTSATPKHRPYNVYKVPSIHERPLSKVTTFKAEIAELEQDLMLRQIAWKSNDGWKEIYAIWIDTVFSDLDVASVQKEVSRYIQTVHHLEKGLPSNTLVPHLKECIMNFKSYMPVITCLRNPSLKPRHWEKINSLIGESLINNKRFTLKDMMELDVFKHKDEIQETSTQASNEATLEEMLQKVTDYWRVADLNLVAHGQRDVAIISKVDEILNALDESMVVLANIRGSRFSGPLQGAVDDLDQKLNMFLQTFEEWIVVQRNWLYLEKVFSAPDIQRQLPEEARLFSTVDKNWRDIMRRTIDRPNALAAGTSAGLFESLKACHYNLEKIHRSLEDYLESKRLLFPRFYFLSNDELLDILANSKDVESVQPYLKKCFGNINQLQFEANERPPFPITKMYSHEGEALLLPSTLRARGQVENWLLNMETVMFDTVKLSLKKGLSEYDEENFMAWMDAQYGQVALTVVQIIFTNRIEETLSSGKDINVQFEGYLTLLRENLTQLAQHVKNEVIEHKINVIVAMVIILVHARDVLDALIKSQYVVANNSFVWTRNLRYHWDDKSNSCLIRQSIASFTYGYEYLGCSTRLVLTPLTDRCYLTLTGALHLHLGGSLTGPAGTGKSETVKDLAKALGKHSIIFNCSEVIDLKMIAQFLAGVSQSGSWLCLDEFNRIDSEVLSVTAQQLQVIRSAKIVKSVRFYFEGNDIRLNPTSGVFITMNPSYVGRVELPDNVNSLFRPISVITPDNVQIAEIILFSNGFSRAKELSHKLVNLYELAKKQLSEQHHYDFGLRSIKALLIMAGENNRKTETSNAYNEKCILIQAIQDSNYPKLLSEDRKLFQQILIDIFSDIPMMPPQLGQLERCIGAALRELSLQRWPSQVEKVIQLYNTLSIRHGVMLVGHTCGGKTTVRKILHRSITLLECEGRAAESVEGGVEENADSSSATIIDMVTLNPKSLSIGELYGELDSDSGEWTDGLLSSTVRGFVQSNSMNTQRKQNKISKSTSWADEEGGLSASPSSRKLVRSTHQWLVLDGPVDTLWVENLNTLLDDSKLLCLANGERIQMVDSMKVIFEVGNLESASPATISRCGMIYLEPDELSWKPLVKSWLGNLREQKVSETDRNTLWDFFLSSVDAGNEFLKKHKEHCAVHVPLLSIIKMLCNLLEAYLKYIGEKSNPSEKDKNNFNDIAKKAEEVENMDDSDLNNENKDNSLEKSLLNKIYLFCYMWAFGGHFLCTSDEAEEMSSEVYIPSFHVENSVDIRAVFDSFLRELFETEFNMSLPLGSNLLYSYYVDIEKNQFFVWDHLVMNATIRYKKSQKQSEGNRDMLYSDNSLIPTPDTICYSFLIALLSLNNHSVLLTGGRGVGKTTLIRDMLRRLSEPGGCKITTSSILGSVLLPSDEKGIIENSLGEFSQFDEYHNRVLTSQISFSLHTDAEKPKQAIQAKLVKRGRDVLGSRNGERVIVYVDDLNMPKPDKYGSQAPLEVLREFLSYGGIYNAKQLHWKDVCNVNLLAVYTIGEQTSQNVNIHRIMAKFNTLCFAQPSSKALHHIYTSQLGKFIDSHEFHGEMRSLKAYIISAVLGIYHNISITLKTTPPKSHYLFNLRDISKVVKGLFQAHPSQVKSRDNFVTLLIHEVSRVFYDRLICEEDRLIFYEVVAKQLHDFLKTRFTAENLRDNFIAYGDFSETGDGKERIYKHLSDKTKLMQTIEACHYHGKILDTGIPQEMVFFSEVYRHIVSAARVLRQPEGHLLLLGIGGTGKKSTVQLASFMQQCEFFEPTFSRNYGLSDFKDDIKQTMFKAGVKGVNVVLFLNDDMVQDSFLEYVCHIITTSDLSTVVDNETKEHIIGELRSDALANGIIDNPKNIFYYFESRMKRNLHVVYSATPSGSNFTEKCSTYPALINNFIIDWYEKWPEEALNLVSNKFLESEELSEEVKSSIANIFVFVYKNVDDMCQKFYDEMKRHYHVTPKTFLDFIFLFKQIFKEIRDESRDKRERLLSGLDKLDITNKMIFEMKSALTVLGPKLEEKSKDTNELMEEILKDEEQLNKVKAVVNREQEVTDNEAKKIAAIARDAEKDLESALPQLADAKAALDSLNKYDIGEIRSYPTPPTMVMTVLSAVCVVLNEKSDWSNAKLLLGDQGFLKKLINYDHENMPDKVYTTLKKYCKNPDFNPSAVGKISVACKSMCTWVLALINYTTVYRLVLPKKIKCDKARQALAQAKEDLLVKQASLKKVEDQFHELGQRYQENLTQLKELEYSKQLTTRRLEKAALLIVALNNEKDRWMKAVQHLEEESIYHLSESIIAAASTSFFGPFTPNYRSTLMQLLTTVIRKYEIEMKEDNDLVSSMSNTIEVQDWINCGLPGDTHSIENAIFIKKTHQWPLIIDPQHQALKWIKKKERGQNVQVVKSGSPKLIEILENSIRLGEVVIVQSVTDVLDPTLNQILSKMTTKRSDQSTLVIGDKEISYNENFRLYMITDVANPKLLPELCIKVTVVNFIITMRGLTGQVLSKIVQHENPELEKNLNEVLELVVKEQMRLTDLENRSLDLLHNAQGNILDDEDLIKTLDNSRMIAEVIKQRVHEAEETKLKITEQREEYMKLAERGALLYFVSQDLSTIDIVYQFSLAWFLDLFSQCIVAARDDFAARNVAERPASARARLNRALEFASCNSIVRRRAVLINKILEGDRASYLGAMIRHFTETFYRVVSYALFAKHQLLFSFHLTTKILLQGDQEDVSEENLLTQKEYNVLLKGSLSAAGVNESGLQRIRGEQKVESFETDGSPLEGIVSLSQSQWEECVHLSTTLTSFHGLCDHLKIHVEWWNKFMSVNNPVEYMLNNPPNDESSPVFRIIKLTRFQQMLLIKILRGDQFTDAMSSYINSAMGVELNTPHGCDLADIYAECNSKVPILFILSTGSDPLSEMLRFVKEIRGSVLHLDIISLGKGQGPKALEKIRAGFTKKGCWVFLQNCHLALSFMPELDEIVREIADPDVDVSPQFRLWLSSEPHPSIPPSILQSSMKVTVEPPPGVRNNLLNTFKSVGGMVTESMFDNTVHRNWKQLLFSISFFHAVIQERWKFGAFGWNLPYHFISSDLNTGIMTLLDIMERTTTIPWQELQLLTGDIIYGGRVRNKWDQRCLSALVKRFYTPDIVKKDFSYFETSFYKPPSVESTFYDCLTIIENLPIVDSPCIFGMNENARFQSCRDEGVFVMNLLNLMQPYHVVLNSSNQATTDQYIIKRSKDILRILPRPFELMKLNTGFDKKDTNSRPRPVRSNTKMRISTPTHRKPGTKSPKNPSEELERRHNVVSRQSSGLSTPDVLEGTPPCAVSTTLDQEKRRFNNLLLVIDRDLRSLCLALTGDSLITAYLQDISQAMIQNKVPESWRKHSYNSQKDLSSWLTNLGKRTTFISHWEQSFQANEQNRLQEPESLWLPAFFYPQGILTAILQNHARQHNVPIDSLTYRHKMTDRKWVPDETSSDRLMNPSNIKLSTAPSVGVNVFGLFLDGACWNPKLELLTKLSFGRRTFPLPEIHFYPHEKTDSKEVECDDGNAECMLYECPVYQTSRRRDEGFFPNFVTSIFLPTEIDPEDWVLNGVAALCQSDD